MKISDLIEFLNCIKERDGDLRVFASSDFGKRIAPASGLQSLLVGEIRETGPNQYEFHMDSTDQISIVTNCYPQHLPAIGERIVIV